MELKQIIKCAVPYGIVRLREKKRGGNPVREQAPLQYCPFCRKWAVFDACGLPHLRREHGLCPNCGSLERHRALFYVYQALFMGKWSGGRKISLLHWAPERSLSDFFMANGAIAYSCCDLHPELYPHVAGVCQRQDALQTSYGDGQFDVIVANHLIEHVSEGKFITEMMRILKPSGILIISTLVFWELEHTFEDPKLAMTPEDRLKYFGQSDHLRKYGADVIERMSKYCDVMFLGAEDLRPYGDVVNTNVFICRRKLIF